MSSACIFDERVAWAQLSARLEFLQSGKDDPPIKLRRVDVLSGDEFERIYAEYARPLWGYLFRMTRSAATAEDLVQEAFCRFLEAPTSPVDARGLRAYLFRIAGNLAIDHARRHKRENEEDPDHELAAPPRGLGQDVGVDPGRFFARLKPRQGQRARPALPRPAPDAEDPRGRGPRPWDAAMNRGGHGHVDAFMRRLAEGTRPKSPLPSAAQVRARMLGRTRLERARRALRPIRLMEGLAMLVGLSGGGVALYLVVAGTHDQDSVAAPETLSLLGPSLSSGSAMLAVFALAAILTLVVVATTFSDT